MEHPHDPYHVRPNPKQPRRGGKELMVALDDLESALTDKVPNIDRLRGIQERIHKTANTFNDDRLVDMLRILSNEVDAIREHPERAALEKILTHLLKIRVALKHL